MRVGIIGTGYVGLVTGVILASKGNEVVCLDKEESIIQQLRSGQPHIYETGIELLLKEVLNSGKISFEKIDKNYLTDCDLIFICVDTPTLNGDIDLNHLFQAITLVGNAIKSTDKFISVIIKSTVLPGTTSSKIKELIETVSGKKHNSFGLGTNPEFLREGSAINDFINADRIIIGAEDKNTEDKLLDLYESWNCEKIVVNSNTAEFVKYVNNSLLALLISFGNEMANISLQDERIQLHSVLKSISADNRINPLIKGFGRANPEILSYLVPGPGYGGSCFPKDLKAFSTFAQGLGVNTYMLNAIQKTNEEQPSKIISLIAKSANGSHQKRYLVLGFSHKPNTDDTRHSISIAIINALIDKGAEVVLHDPVSLESAMRHFKGKTSVSYTLDWFKYLNEVDVVVILTAWKEYYELNSSKCLELLKGKTIIDARLMFSQNSFINSTYISF